MEHQTVLTGSAACTRVLTFGVPALLVVLWLRGRRKPAGAPLVLGPRTERLAMLAIVAYVLVTRLAFLDADAQPAWYFTRVGPLFIAEALQQGHWGRYWLGLLANVQVLWEYQSAIMAPIAAVAQLALGPSPSLPGVIGAWWSLVAVLVAWRLGRIVESPLFGVLFAGLVAVSPLQLTWGRLGGISVGAPVHVLGVLWAGWVVGQRSGVFGALLLGVFAWTSVYHYFAARVGLVLAPIALWTGWRRGRRGVGRLAALTAAFGLALGTCVASHHAVSPQQSLWPDYRGYAGNRGETTPWQVVASALNDTRGNLGHAVSAYAWHDRMGPLAASLTGVRTPWTGTVLQADVTGGGLALLPVVVLGMLGLLHCLRHPITCGIWLTFAGVTLLPILLGVPTARRFLIFDVAWCAFAAFGLSALLGSRVVRGIGVRTRGWLAAGMISALGVWAAGAVAFGDASLPPFRTTMPFGESGFGDGLTCLACAQSARAWRHEIEDGRPVVLFDTDVDRENRTAPGGLWAYGKLAALSAGHPDRFLDFYALLTNFDIEPPRAGPIALQPPDDVTSAIAERIEAATPRAIVWWFSQPNAWERTLIDALVAAGSTRSEPGLPSTALSDRLSALGTRAVRVETPWERRADALRALRTLLVAEPVRPCVRLEVVTRRDYQQPPLAITPLQVAEQPPDWGIAGWREVRVGTASAPVGEAIGLDTSRRAGGELLVHLVDFWGKVSTWPVGAAPQPEGLVAPRPVPVGRSCAVRQRGEWWIADPIAGTLAPVGRSVDVPLADVVGVAPHGGDLLVATADQRLHVVDPERGEVRRSFAATIVPPRRTHYGECAMLATGDGWIASLDQMRGLLSVYDETGRPLGRLPLTRTLSTSPMGLQAIHGTDDLLGVGHDLSVTTIRLVPEPDCADGTP